MEVYLPDKYFKDLFFSLLKYEKPKSIEEYINSLLGELIEIIENKELNINSKYIRESNEVMMLLNSKTDYMGIWSHPIIIPIKIRDILESYRKYSPIKYDDYQSHVRFVPGRVRKNITNALCYILIVKSLKILDKEKVDLFSENSIPKPKRPKLGQTVEMKSGPFRGEKGKIVHIDEHHNELTIELIGLDALDLWALPITVKEEQIRIIN